MICSLEFYLILLLLLLLLLSLLSFLPVGYYTRSGYVPGPICKYNFTKVWNVHIEENSKLDPPVSSVS